MLAETVQLSGKGFSPASGTPHATMHSVRRVKRSEEQRQLRRKREAGEILRYCKLENQILDARTDPATFDRTSELLALNPDHYTIWNIRRELISAMEDKQKSMALASDLKLTESLLPTHPKVYWIWNHRRWVLTELSRSERENEVWVRELGLTSKLLERDARNFHGWSYRRWIVANSAVSSDQNEFHFTTKKINENFSNFSAWHYRAQLIAHIPKAPPLQSELDYVYGAVAMDPKDQSGWLYYQWLLESPQFQDEITPKLLAEQSELVREIWDEEKSVWAARLLCELVRMQNLQIDQSIVRKMAELDPLRKHRYESS